MGRPCTISLLPITFVSILLTAATSYALVPDPPGVQSQPLAAQNIEIAFDDNGTRVVRTWGTASQREPRISQRGAFVRIDKMSPDLLRATRSARPAESVDFCAGVERWAPIRRLPSLRGVARESLEGQMLAAERATMLHQMREQSALSRAAVAQRLRQHGVLHSESFMANIVCGSAPIALIEDIAARPEVTYLFLDERSLPPPIPPESLEDAAARLGTDFLFDSGYTGRAPGLYVGLLDTGVTFRDTAPLDALMRRDPSAWTQDCTQGTNDLCQGSDPSDNHNHGTKTMFIMRNTAAAENASLSDAVIDSFKVSTSVGGAPYRDAILRAFEAASGWSDIIVANVQPDPTETYFPIAEAANTAYELGIAVIAAHGNKSGCREDCGVPYPASAEFALAVGEFDLNLDGTSTDQRIAYTHDYRVKPDVQAGTPVSVLGEFGDTLNEYRGTSAATPQIGATAAVLWHYLSSSGLQVEPGHIYATLLAAGKNHTSPAGDILSGAGPVELPDSWFSTVRQVGSVDLSNSTYLPITLPSGYLLRDLEVAWWWEDDRDNNWQEANVGMDGHHWIRGYMAGSNPVAYDPRGQYATWGKLHVDAPQAGSSYLWLDHFEGRYFVRSSTTKRVYYAVTYRKYPRWW